MVTREDSVPIGASHTLDRANPGGGLGLLNPGGGAVVAVGRPLRQGKSETVSLGGRSSESEVSPSEASSGVGVGGAWIVVPFLAAAMSWSRLFVGAAVDGAVDSVFVSDGCLRVAVNDALAVLSVLLLLISAAGGGCDDSVCLVSSPFFFFFVFANFPVFQGGSDCGGGVGEDEIEIRAMLRVASVGKSSSSAIFDEALEAGLFALADSGAGRAVTTTEAIGSGGFTEPRSPDACANQFATDFPPVPLLFASFCCCFCCCCCCCGCCFVTDPRPGGIPLAWPLACALAALRSDTMAVVCGIAGTCCVTEEDDGLSEGNSSTLLTLTLSGFLGGYDEAAIGNGSTGALCPDEVDVDDAGAAPSLPSCGNSFSQR